MLCFIWSKSTKWILSKNKYKNIYSFFVIFSFLKEFLFRIYSCFFVIFSFLEESFVFWWPERTRYLPRSPRRRFRAEKWALMATFANMSSRNESWRLRVRCCRRRFCRASAASFSATTPSLSLDPWSSSGNSSTSAPFFRKSSSALRFWGKMVFLFLVHALIKF